MTENELCEIGERYFIKRGWDVYREVPIMGRCLDMILSRRENKTIIGIEFKLHHWKQAIIQTRHLKFAISLRFIAMPEFKKGAPLKFLAASRDSGVGIMIFRDGIPRIELRPNLSKSIYDWQLKRLHGGMEYVRQNVPGQFAASERWSDWAKRHNIYAKSRT